MHYCSAWKRNGALNVRLKSFKYNAVASCLDPPLENYNTQNALFPFRLLPRQRRTWSYLHKEQSHDTFPVKMADNLPSEFDVIVIGTGMCGSGTTWTKCRKSVPFLPSLSGVRVGEKCWGRVWEGGRKGSEVVWSQRGTWRSREGLGPAVLSAIWVRVDLVDADCWGWLLRGIPVISLEGGRFAVSRERRVGILSMETPWHDIISSLISKWYSPSFCLAIS